MRGFSIPLTVRRCAVRRPPPPPTPRVIPQKVTSHQNRQLIRGERGEQAFYIGKKPVENPAGRKKHPTHFGGGFFDSGFLQCLGVVAW